MLIWNDVSFAAVHAAEKLDPLCLKQNEEISIFLRGHANRAKDMLVTNKAAGYYYGDLPWTAKEVREAEDRIMAPYLMQANQRVSKEHLSGRSR